MATIGIIGGWGWEASAAYYRIINREVRARLGGWNSARIILDSQDMQPLATSKTAEDFEAIRRTLLDSARRLEKSGADVLVIACNTVHRFADAVMDAVEIPLLHIADVAAAALARDSHRRVGILGSLATMQAPFYRRRLTDSHGLDVLAPDRPLRADVADIIANSLTRGTSPEACAARLDPVVEHLKDRGCTAVLLACTEFGLAYGAIDVPVIERALPLYDTSVLHALAAADIATTMERRD